MRDADIVHAIAKDERDGLSAAYRAYADRLYDYSLVTLDDAEAAADTVHGIFLIAREQIARLRDTRTPPLALCAHPCPMPPGIASPRPSTSRPAGRAPLRTLSPDDPESSSTKPSAVFPARTRNPPPTV